jgi:hypothetical protein
LFSIIGKVNAELPNACIDLYSNGASLTREKFERLGTIKNFQHLNISLNDHRKAVYEALMRLPFEHTIARLTMIHNRLQSEGLPFSVVISRVCDYRTDEEFRAWVSERFPLFTVHTHRRSDRLGQVNVAAQHVPHIGCAMWFNISIMATGVVAYCRMDGEGQFPIGEVKERHVLEIYNDANFRAMREQRQTRIGTMPCGQCTFF